MEQIWWNETLSCFCFQSHFFFFWSYFGRSTQTFSSIILIFAINTNIIIIIVHPKINECLGCLVGKKCGGKVVGNHILIQSNRVSLCSLSLSLYVLIMLGWNLKSINDSRAIFNTRSEICFFFFSIKKSIGRVCVCACGSFFRSDRFD